MGSSVAFCDLCATSVGYSVHVMYFFIVTFTNGYEYRLMLPDCPDGFAECRFTSLYVLRFSVDECRLLILVQTVVFRAGEKYFSSWVTRSSIRTHMTATCTRYPVQVSTRAAHQYKVTLAHSAYVAMHTLLYTVNRDTNVHTKMAHHSDTPVYCRTNHGSKALHAILVAIFHAFQVLVVVFSVISGLVSLYFLANREDGVTSIGEVRQGLEWVTMFLWIVVCLVMAHLTPAADALRVRKESCSSHVKGLGLRITEKPRE